MTLSRHHDEQLNHTNRTEVEAFIENLLMPFDVRMDSQRIHHAGVLLATNQHRMMHVFEPNRFVVSSKYRPRC